MDARISPPRPSFASKTELVAALNNLRRLRFRFDSLTGRGPPFEQISSRLGGRSRPNPTRTKVLDPLQHDPALE